jgi:hypothetical protein
MAGVAEENRRRLAGFLCVVGLVLILVGIGLTLKFQSDVAGLPTPVKKLPDNKAMAKVLQAVLFWVLVLIVVFTVCTVAFLRWSRRFRKYLLARPHPPTPADDVWARHRLPGEPSRRPAAPEGRSEGPGES